MDFKVENVNVYGMEQAIIASGYPMALEIKQEMTPKDLERAEKLGKAPSGSGHDCYLKGIVVQADITAPQYWWLQFGRYHFADIISSQSKMHRLMQMDIDKQCNNYVDEEIKQHLKKLIDMFNKESLNETRGKKLFQRIVSNCPMGLMLTARITTNYLQLKTIYYQRRKHKLSEWHTFCNWALTLPGFIELALGRKVE